MRLVTYDYIFYGFEKEEKICYSRLKELEERNLCRFCVDEPFRESGSLQRFFFRNLLRSPTMKKPRFCFFFYSAFRWPNLNAFFMLHILIFFSFFYCGEKKSARDEEEKKQTKPEQRIISEDDWGERENMKERKFHFMDVVYRICADSAFDCFGIEKKRAYKYFSTLRMCVFHSVSSSRFRWCLICLCLFISTSARFCTKFASSLLCTSRWDLESLLSQLFFFFGQGVKVTSPVNNSVTKVLLKRKWSNSRESSGREIWNSMK